MDNTFNMRNPADGEVVSMHKSVEALRLQKMRTKALSKLLKGETIDLRNTPELFEALNRERMEFETILKLHPDQVKDCIGQVKEDREGFEEGRYWNRKSPAKWGLMGHIPPCVYHARPPEYWADKALVKNFFNMFTKFRISQHKI